MVKVNYLQASSAAWQRVNTSSEAVSQTMVRIQSTSDYTRITCPSTSVEIQSTILSDVTKMKNAWSAPFSLASRSHSVEAVVWASCSITMAVWSIESPSHQRALSMMLQRILTRRSRSDADPSSAITRCKTLPWPHLWLVIDALMSNFSLIWPCSMTGRKVRSRDCARLYPKRPCKGTKKTSMQCRWRASVASRWSHRRP